MSKKQQLTRPDNGQDGTGVENEPSCPLTGVKNGGDPCHFRLGFSPDSAENDTPGTLSSLFFYGKLPQEPTEETPRRSLKTEPTSELGRILTKLSAAKSSTTKPKRKSGELYLKGGTTLAWMQATAGLHQLLALTVLLFMRMRGTKTLRLDQEIQLAAHYGPGNRWVRAIKHLEDCGAFRIDRKRGGRSVAIDIWEPPGS